MKFGGTSVGTASSIQKVVEIIRASARESELLVVVSALSGVTNQLIDAALQSAAGDRPSVAMIFHELRERHEAVANALIHSPAQRGRVACRVKELFHEGEALCERTMRRRELTPATRDSISSLGERLSAPIVAAALAEHGVPSQAMEATELIQTDSCHGAADPRMDATRDLCRARLRPLLQQGVVPVVTGFLGATEEGALTTLGRGGSDYSATILGAALDADEVVIWTDVDGLMTADPRLVPGASTIPEISYREAAELAYFGAKVLHCKTLRAVTQCGIPLWIRNTFAPEQAGTKVTPEGPTKGAGVKGLTALSDVALITVGGSRILGVPEVLRRTLAATTAVRANVLLISPSPSQNEIYLVLSASFAEPTIAAMRLHFAPDLAHQRIERITLDPNVALVTAVGQEIAASGIVDRTFSALQCNGVDVLAVGEGSSECNLSFVVAKDDMKAALVTAHREFQLDMPNPQALPEAAPNGSAAARYSESGQPTASAD
jgi:aspartate kinase